MLAESYPRVALDLLERFFDLGETFDLAQAYCDKATALLTLRDIAGAIESYEAALRREDAYPQVQTNAYLALACLIVRQRLTARYAQALELLQQHRDNLLFPVQVFCWNSVLAIVMDERGEQERAVEAANVAIDAASQTHSGLSRHANLGLVDERGADLLKRVKEIVERRAASDA
ncbi:MAG: hypothetical protein JXO22_15405 [Phycisphaerae bacterium]|nr:hypothetical protein [Phycisphaerae bacterium]